MRLRPLIFALLCWLVVVAVLVLVANRAVAQTDQQALANTAFDAHIQRASVRWLPQYDWRWLRAQCFQESRLQPRAVSPAGARGLCQFMPGTWSDAQRAIGVRDINSPRENAWAAGWYMRRMVGIWVWDRTDHQRLELAQASYNAGVGNILAAQRLCGRPRDWYSIKQCLPDVTGHHSAETIGYVRSIAHWCDRMEPSCQRASH